MVILIFSGSDKVGKTTLILALHKATGYKYSCIDRFSGTSICYGKFWKREIDEKQYLLQDLKLMNDAILVYLEAPIEVIAQRFEIHHEKDIPLDRIEELKHIYEDYLTKTPLFTVRIDTSNSKDYCVDMIKNAITAFENETAIQRVKRLEKAILTFGDKIGDTKELRNISLDLNKFNGVSSYDLRKYLKDNNLMRPEEWGEYNLIGASIKNSIRLKIEYFKNQTNESRQFVHHSDSCISMFQVMFRLSTLYCTVHLRSSNVNKSLLLDLYAMDMLIEELNSTYFFAPRVKLHIDISSAHIFVDDNGMPK